VFVTNNRIAALKRMGLFYDDLKSGLRSNGLLGSQRIFDGYGAYRWVLYADVFACIYG